MKTEHTLKSGVVLKVGSKYRNGNYIETVLFMNEDIVLTVDQKKLHLDVDINDPVLQTFTPYQEPEKKELEGYEVYFVEYNERICITLEYYKGKPKDTDTFKYYTPQEAKEKGLDLSMFNLK